MAAIILASDMGKYKSMACLLDPVSGKTRFDFRRLGKALIAHRALQNIDPTRKFLTECIARRGSSGRSAFPRFL